MTTVPQSNEEHRCNLICRFLFGCDTWSSMQNNKINTLFYILSWAVLVMIGGLLVSGFYFYYIDGNPPIEIEQPTLVRPLEVRPGDSITMSIYLCKNVSAPGIVNLSFLNRETGDVNGFKSLTMKLANKEECGFFEYTLDVPIGVTPGKTIIRGTNSYDVNILATRHVEWETEEFLVLE